MSRPSEPKTSVLGVVQPFAEPVIGWLSPFVEKAWTLTESAIRRAIAAVMAGYLWITSPIRRALTPSVGYDELAAFERGYVSKKAASKLRGLAPFTPYRKDSPRVASAPNPFQFAILTGLNRLGKHVYGGTVPAATIAKRRAANKAARAARKAGR